jgi:hypothetical protein
LSRVLGLAWTAWTAVFDWFALHLHLHLHLFYFSLFNRAPSSHVMNHDTTQPNTTHAHTTRSQTYSVLADMPD